MNDEQTTDKKDDRVHLSISARLVANKIENSNLFWFMIMILWFYNCLLYDT